MKHPIYIFVAIVLFVGCNTNTDRPQNEIVNDSEFGKYSSISIEKTMELECDWKLDLLRNVNLRIQIPALTKLDLKRNYQIPNKLFQLKAEYHGIYSASEEYENLTGSIIFDNIKLDSTKIRLNLKGDLKRMMQVEQDLLIDDSLSLHNLETMK